MDNRKTTFVKLEIYEDKVDEFKGLLWVLKKTLNKDGIDRIRNNYHDPSFFDKNNRKFVEFLQYIIEMIKIQSIDGENEIPSIDIYSVAEGIGDGKESEMTLPVFDDESPFTGHYHELGKVDDLEDFDESKKAEFLEMIGEESTIKADGTQEEALNDEIKFFIRLSKDLRKKLSEKREAELVRFIKHHIKARSIKHYRRDSFWEAAKSAQFNHEVIPPDLMLLFNLNSMYGHRYSSNVIFQDGQLYTPKKMTSKEKYNLTTDLFQHTRYWFRDLADGASRDYQLRIITGFILSKIGLLDSDEDYKGSKDWRVYLSEMVKNWLIVIEDENEDLDLNKPY